MSKRPREDIFDPVKRLKLQSVPDLDDPIPSTSTELDEDEILMLASQAVENDERVNAFTSDSSSFSSKNQNRYSSQNDDIYKYSNNNAKHKTNTFNLSMNARSHKTASDDYNSKKNQCDITDMDSLSNSSMLSSNGHFLEVFRKTQEENKKYQVQQNELSEKNIVKNGEISILRAQLKSCQVEIANAKMEKVKNFEKYQMEFSDKLKQLNFEAQKQKSELDLRVMEIAQLKEKCRSLESSRIKFVEPSPITDNFKWPGLSQRLNSSFNKQDGHHSKMITTKEISVQTWNKKKVKLYPIKRPDYPLKTAIDNCIFNCTKSENPIIFSSNETTQLIGHFNFLLMREKILSNLNGSSKSINTKGVEYNIKLDYVYGDLSSLMNMPSEELGNEKSVFHGLKIALLTKEFLLKSLDQLQNLSDKTSMRVLKEMDVKYFESSETGCNLLAEKNYFDESAWFKDEQCIDSRRLLAVLAVICQYIKPLADFVLGTETIEISKSDMIIDFKKNLYYLSKYCENKSKDECVFLDIILEILRVISKIRCSHLLTGLLSSICFLMDSALRNCIDLCDDDKVCAVTKEMLMLRPHIAVIESMMKMLVAVENMNFLGLLCNNTDKGNLKYDFAEGVAVYNKDTCSLQILCNILETWSTHFVGISHISSLISITDNLLKLNGHGESVVNWNITSLHCKCLCLTRLTRCIWVYLRRCASLCDQHFENIKDVNVLRRLCSTLRAGIMLLHFCILKDIEFLSRLKDYEGHCQIFVSICSKLSDKLKLHVVHKEALVGAKNSMTFVLGNIEEPLAEDIWEQCFEQFSIAD